MVGGTLTNPCHSSRFILPHGLVLRLTSPRQSCQEEISPFRKNAGVFSKLVLIVADVHSIFFCGKNASV